jgi:hypothetical protein
MPSWGEILKEVQRSAEERQARGEQGPDFDAIRRRYLTRLYEVTGRPVILYSTDWFRTQDPADRGHEKPIATAKTRPSPPAA